MRDDLLDAQAAIDWAVSKFPSFERRIKEWLRDSIEIRIEKLKPPALHSPILIRQKTGLPLVFNAEFGAYINSLRSSLDILATTLAVRYGACRPDYAYFPIAASEASFVSGNYKGKELINGLPAAERTIIESLKPYKGGNEMLFPSIISTSCVSIASLSMSKHRPQTST